MFARSVALKPGAARHRLRRRYTVFASDPVPESDKSLSQTDFLRLASFSCSGCLELEPLADEPHGLRQGAGAETEGALHKTRLAADVARDVEDRRLTLA